MHRRNQGFVLQHRSLAAQICDWSRHYFRTLCDTFSIRFLLTEAIAAVVFAVGLLTGIPLVWVTAVVGATALVALGVYVTTQSFVREVRTVRKPS